MEGPRTRILSRFDNPELRTLIQLPDYSRFIGGGLFLSSTVPSLVISNGQLMVVPGGVDFAPGDLQLYATGTVATGVDSNRVPLIENRAAVADSLVPWPEAAVSLDGGEGDVADLYARGVRLGYTPLTIQTLVTNPNGTLGARLSTVEVSLDPEVILVPVQVFAINTPRHRNYGGLGNVLGNLEVWDQVPTFFRTEDPSTGQTTYSFSSWFGAVGSWGAIDAPTWFRAPFVFDAYLPGGKLAPSPSDASAAPDNSNYFTPDSIWRDCGVQFRLVRFDTVDLTDDDCGDALTGSGCADRLNDNSDQPTPVDIHTVCDQFETAVSKQKLDGAAPTIPTLIASFALSDVGCTGQGDVAITVAGFGDVGPVSCVGRAAECGPRRLVLAHEVGHWAGGGLEDDCTSPGGPCEINAMNTVDQKGPPSRFECGQMRAWALKQWSNYWGCRGRNCLPRPPFPRGLP